MASDSKPHPKSSTAHRTRGLQGTTLTVVDTVKRLLDFTYQSTLLLDRLHELKAALELLDALTCLADKVVRPVYDLKDTKAEYVIKLRTEVHRVRLAVEKGHRFVGKVQDCCQQRGRTAAAKTGVQSGDIEPLLFLLNQATLHLDEAGRYYEEFHADCDQARECSVRASEECLARSDESRYCRTVVWVAGGTAGLSLTAGIVGGGYTTFAALSGGLTLEIAGLGVAVGAAMMVGTTAAVFTHKTAKQLNEVEKNLQELSRAFDSIARTTSELLETAYHLKCNLDKAQRYVTSVQQCHDRHKDMRQSQDKNIHTSICEALDLFHSECDAIHESTLSSELRSGLQEMKLQFSREEYLGAGDRCAVVPTKL